MITPSEIVRRYWQWPWTFKANGDLHIRRPDRVIVIKEASYVPKSQRGVMG